MRLLLAGGAGVLWALSFPRAGMAGLAWAVPGLVLMLTAGLGPGPAFRAAYLAGAAHYLISLSWLRFIPFPVGAYTGWLALSFFLALLVPAWAWVCWRLGAWLGVAPPGTHDWKDLAQRIAGTPWLTLNLWYLLCASAWVAWEMALARMFGGFPWNLQGASQYRMVPLIQIASVTGVYGVSFLIVWFSVSLLTAVLLLTRFPDQPALWRRPMVFPALMVVATAGSGFLTVLTVPAQPRQISVALIQPSIPQTVIFDPASATNRFGTLLRLTERALAAKPDLVIWPEASLPGGLDPGDFERLAEAIREAEVWMIFGADEITAELDAQGKERLRAYNSAFLLGPDGEVKASYRKRRLVMFGEYIPLARWLPFLRRLAPIGEGFEAGTEAVPFHLGSLGLVTSVLICFEDNFPQQAREHAPPGTGFLVNITNDGWFGRSSAQWQHAANAAFRAVENGVPLVRCTNNGITCWIDALGRFHSDRLAAGKDVYEEGFEVTTVSFGTRHRTIYNQFGDLFGWSCVGATMLGLACERLRGRPGRAQRSKRPPPRTS